MLKLAWNMCHRKRRYSVREANFAVQKINERGGRQVHQYYCGFCKARHIGGVIEPVENEFKDENNEKIEILA